MALERQIHAGRGLSRPQRFGEVVAEELVRALAQGEYAAGQRLPTEPQMQEDFGISRTVLREALKFVESRGMITIRQGRGAVVEPVDCWDLLDSVVLTAMLEHHPTPDAFEQLMAVRGMIEPELTRLAAVRLGEDQLAELSRLLDQMASQLENSETFLQLDVAFHAVITRGAGNLIAQSIMTAIEQPLRVSRRLTNTIPRALAQAQEAHQSIFDRLTVHDGDGASQAMVDHLAWSRDNLLARWTREPTSTSAPANVASA